MCVYTHCVSSVSVRSFTSPPKTISCFLSQWNIRLNSALSLGIAEKESQVIFQQHLHGQFDTSIKNADTVSVWVAFPMCFLMVLLAFGNNCNPIYASTKSSNTNVYTAMQNSCRALH